MVGIFGNLSYNHACAVELLGVWVLDLLFLCGLELGDVGTKVRRVTDVSKS